MNFVNKTFIKRNKKGVFEEIRVVFEDTNYFFYVTMPKSEKNKHKKKCQYHTVEKEEFINALKDNSIYPIPDRFLTRETAVRHEELSDRNKAYNRKRYELGLEILRGNEYTVFNKRERTKLIKEISDETGKKKDFLTGCLSDLLIGGIREEAMGCRYGYCGNPGESKNYNTKPGPKNPLMQADPSNKLNNLFDNYLTDYMNSGKSFSLVHNDMVIENFLNDEGYEKKTAPDIRQFTNYALRTLDPCEVERRHSSEREYEMNNRVLSKTEDADVFSPMSHVEVDETPLDVVLVSRKDPTQVIGRPTLHLAVDVYSRFIVGDNFGLENENFDSAVLTMESILTNRLKRMAENGIEIYDDDYDISGYLPAHIISDRGSFYSKGITKVCDLYKIRVDNKQSYRGDLKGIVERQFRSINDYIKKKLPGAVLKNYSVRGDQDPKDVAVLNADQLRNIIDSWILSHNRKVIDHFIASGDQMGEVNGNLPTELFKHGLQYGIGAGRYLEPEEREHFALKIRQRSHNRAMERGRIRYKNDMLVYVPATKTARVWAEQIYVEYGSYNVDLILDRNDMYHAHVEDPKVPGVYHLFKLINKQEDLKGYMMDEIEQIVSQALAYNAEKKKDKRADKRLHDITKEMIEEAENNRKALESSLKNKKKDISESREQERKEEYEQKYKEETYTAPAPKEKPKFNTDHIGIEDW